MSVYSQSRPPASLLSGQTGQKENENGEEDDAKVMTFDVKLVNRLTMQDLQSIQDAFTVSQSGQIRELSLDIEQFCEILSIVLNKGSREEYEDLFKKIDVSKEGFVDWDKFCSHMLLEYYEKDDRMKTTQVPQWRDLRFIPCPHKETIVRIAALINPSRYITVSKEGAVGMWSLNMKLLRTVHVQTDPDEVKQRDLWVTDFTPMHNIYKLAIALTSKEIAIYDLSSKAEFLCQYRVQGLEATPLCMSYWSNPDNPSESKLVFGDVSGQVNAILFSAATITLFDRPAQSSGSNNKQDICLNVNLTDLARGQFKNARYVKHCGHTEWTRQVMYTPYLDCFISCSTNYKSSVVLGWIEKSKINMRTTHFKIPQGVNAFDYNDKANLIATAGVNHHVCLWNPYVISKPVGVLRGHMQSVIAVKFIQSRGQLISLSKDKVLRIWDTHLQVCLQRLSGMFPKGPEVTINMHFDEERTKLLTTFNHQLTSMVMKAEVKDRVMSHEQPVTAAIYNSKFNQVVSVCVASVITMWMVDTGQKVKQFANAHGNAEITAVAQDASEMRLFTGSSDGTVKIWDLNGHCHHILVCSDGNPADISQILILKRTIIVIGWDRNLCVFRDTQFNNFYVSPSDWKGRQEHVDDILSMAFSSPHTLVTGSYDGDVVVWNTSSEQSSRHLNIKGFKRKPKSSRPSRGTSANGPTSSQQTFATQPNEEDTLTPQIPETPASASSVRSRRMNRIMSGKTINDGQDESVDAVTKLIFIENRPGSAGSTFANLISAGSNGWVRFWSSTTGRCMGEFVAHAHASSLTMEADESFQFLVTADADGLVKVWDISEYCVTADICPDQEPPPLLKQFQAHTDSINSLSIFIRNERLLILTASSDCSVALHDIQGRLIGMFGQEEHWKIEPLTEEELDDSKEMEVDKAEEDNPSEQCDILRVDIDELVNEDDEPQAEQQEGFNPEFRLNTWQHTILGKSYKETRSEKRERRQPQLLKDPPYLTWERTGQPPAGPYKSLDTAELNFLDSIEKPDFVTHPERYFGERTEGKEKQLPKLPILPPITDNLQKRYDEKNLFPKDLLEREAKSRAVREVTSRTSRHTGRISHVRINVPDSTSSRVTSSDSSRRATGSWSKQLMRKTGSKVLGVMQEEDG